MAAELSNSLDRALELVLALKKTARPEDAENEQEKYPGEPLFDVKMQALTKYQIELMNVVLAKAEGRSLTEIEDNIYESCVQRTVLERIRPLELKVQDNVDKMIKIYEDGGQSSGNLALRPNLDDFGSSEESEEGGDDSGDDEGAEGGAEAKPVGVYKPRKEISMPYPGDDEPTTSTKEQELLEKKRKRDLKSSHVRDLLEVYGDSPLETHENIQTQKAQQSRVLRQAEERRKFEEENFKRVSLSKKQRKQEERALTRDDYEAITTFGDARMLAGDGVQEFLAQQKKSRGRKKFQKSSDILFKPKKKRGRR